MPNIPRDIKEARTYPQPRNPIPRPTSRPLPEGNDPNRDGDLTDSVLRPRGPAPSNVTGLLADKDFLVGIIQTNLEIATTGASLLHSVEFDPNTNVIYMTCGLGWHERYAEPGAAPRFEIRVRNVDCNQEVLDEVEPLAVQAMEQILGRSLDKIRGDYTWLSETAYDLKRNSLNDTLHVRVNPIVWRGIKEAGL